MDLMEECRHGSCVRESEMKDMATFFEEPGTDSHASLKFPCDIGEGRKAIEKKNVKSSPSTLNGAMRDDGW